MYKKINFINLSKEEKRLVLSWRNDERIKKWMHTNDDITLKEHLNFIDSLKDVPSKDYFVVKDDNEYLGVIDLNDEYLGIYANPDKKRVGNILLNEIIQFAFKEKRVNILKAEVYLENNSAIKLYKRFGFEIVNNDGNLLTMELKNENR